MSHTLVIAANHVELRRLRVFLELALGSADSAVSESMGPLDLDLLGRVELAIHEVATNVIDHAEADDQELSITIDRSGLVLRVELRDRGLAANLPLADELDSHPRVRGYGMLIVELLASRVSYERTEGVNTWKIEFDLTPSRPPPR